MRFCELQFEPHPAKMGGVHAKHKYDNGYEVSVIRTYFSQGGDRGLYELAIGRDDKLCYDISITQDVVGYLTKEEVERTMREIEVLPSPTIEKEI